jgi:hypothetical protein
MVNETRFWSWGQSVARDVWYVISTGLIVLAVVLVIMLLLGLS